MKKSRGIIRPAKSATIIYKHDAIVIGSNLTALLYAFNNKLPIFFSHPRRPFRFDHLPTDTHLECIGLSNETRLLHTHSGNIKVGPAEEELWARLLFILSLTGQAPLSLLCGSLRYNGKTLVCSNEYSKIAEIEFDKAYYFGDDNCTGLVEKEVADTSYICYDWIAFNRGGKHEIDLIETDDDFVNQIWFYPSDRIDGNTRVKDACIVSHLTDSTMDEFDYSQTMARFKMIHEMEERGMRGLFNGHSPTGVPKYYKFRTTIIGRERRAQSQGSLPSCEKIALVTESQADLLKALPESSQQYQKILEHI